MSLNYKVIVSLLAGAVAGFLSWIIIDFNGFYRIEPQGAVLSYAELIKAQSFVGAVFGLLVGFALGFVNGISIGSKKQFKRELLWGSLAGLMGGLIGLMIGQLFFGSFYTKLVDMSHIPVLKAIAFLGMILVRGIGWGLIGLFVGIVQGLPTKSRKTSKHGAIGGFIGGLIGGMLFEIVPYILPIFTANPGVISRGISLTVTGAAIGLFIGLAQTIFKQAWIRVLKGKNEGKEYIISKSQTTIGRDELADIPLFGDMNVSHSHAIINMDNHNQYTIHSSGAQTALMVNNQLVHESHLTDGDLITIASFNLEFHEKAGKKAIPVKDAPVKRNAPPVSSSLTCPYCGGAKDPVTGDCMCSIGPQNIAASDADISGKSTFNGNPRLIGISGAYTNKSLDLKAMADTEIGREQSKSISLTLDNTVSRNHAHISFESGVYVLYDNGSSNGTFVNGVKITRQIIQPGDTIQFGASTFRFEQ